MDDDDDKIRKSLSWTCGASMSAVMACSAWPPTTHRLAQLQRRPARQPGSWNTLLAAVGHGLELWMEWSRANHDASI